MDPGPRFEEHIKTAHPYKCGICDLRYVEEEKLRKHKKSHQKGKVKEETNERKAVDVEKYFQPASETKAAPQKNSNKVKGAKKMSAAALTLESPKSREERRSKSMDSSTVVVSNFWKCKHCETPFSSESDLRSHEEKPHSKPCSACSMNFIHASDLKRHQIEMHNSASKGFTKCDVCGELTEKKSLCSHKKAIHTFACGDCDLMFAQKSKLWRHKIEAHLQGTWVNRPVSKSVEGKCSQEPQKVKVEKLVPKKASKLKEEKWETVMDKKVSAVESRVKLEKGTSEAKASGSGVKSGGKASTSTKSLGEAISAPTSEVKTDSLAVGGSTSKERTTQSKKTEKIGGVPEKLEECPKCKEVCTFNLFCSIISCTSSIIPLGWFCSLIVSHR